jgi:putative intracellular protease/amidase
MKPGAASSRRDSAALPLAHLPAPSSAKCHAGLTRLHVLLASMPNQSLARTMPTPVTLAAPPPITPVLTRPPPQIRPGALRGRSVAILVVRGVDAAQVEAVQIRIRRAGGHVDLIAPSLGVIETPRGSTLMPDGTFTTRCPLDYDAVVVPSGDLSRLHADGAAIAFVARAYLHATPIGLIGDGADLLRGVSLPPAPDGDEVVANGSAVVRASTACPGFIEALAARIAAGAPGSPDADPDPDAHAHRIAS